MTEPKTEPARGPICWRPAERAAWRWPEPTEPLPDGEQSERDDDNGPTIEKETAK